MVTIAQVARLVRQTRCLEETEHDLGVPPVLHAHQALVVDGDGQLTCSFESLASIFVLVCDDLLFVGHVVHAAALVDTFVSAIG